MTDPAPHWMNPQVFALNTEPHHSLLLPYSSEKQALENTPTSSPHYLPLNTWDFKFFNSYSEA